MVRFQISRILDFGPIRHGLTNGCANLGITLIDPSMQSHKSTSKQVISRIKKNYALGQYPISDGLVTPVTISTVVLNLTLTRLRLSQIICTSIAFTGGWKLQGLSDKVFPESRLDLHYQYKYVPGPFFFKYSTGRTYNKIMRSMYKT